MKSFRDLNRPVVQEGENNQVKDGDPCWTGYQMVGMKNKGGKKVPNCVPVKEEKEESEYDYEGDMARGQLQSIINNAQRVHDMLKDKDNLPEWVQSKITLAEDYISTVANYMMSEVDEGVSNDSWKDKTFGPTKVIQQKYKVKTDTKTYNVKAETEAHAHKLVSSHTPGSKIVSIEHKGRFMEEVEPIEELSKDTLKSYIPAAARDLSKKGVNAGIEAKSGKPGVTKEYGDHFEKRYKGIIKATRKLAKEQAEPIDELSRETLHQYWIKAVPWSITHKMIASAARKDAAAITDPNDHYGAHDLRMKARGHSMIGKKRDAGIEKANARLKKDSEKNYYERHWKANRGYYGPEKPDNVKEGVDKSSTANMPADIGTPAQLSLKVTPKKLETPVYESRQLEIVREALADAKKKDAAKKKEQKVNPGGNDKFQSEPELTSSITKNT